MKAVSLKELIRKISQRLITHTRVTETQSFTALGKNWRFRRIGNVVYVDAPNDTTGSVAAGYTTIGTLSASMRPDGNVYLKCTNAHLDRRLFISPYGTVQYYQPTATTGAANSGFSGYSYIVGGVLRNLSVFKAFSRFASLRKGGGVDESGKHKRVNSELAEKIGARWGHDKYGNCDSSIERVLTFFTRGLGTKRSNDSILYYPIFICYRSLLCSKLWHGPNTIYRRNPEYTDYKFKNHSAVLSVTISGRRWAA